MTPGLAAAGFCGLITICFGREGMIDGGEVRFGDGDPGGSIGSGGFGTLSGNGGCDLSRSRLGVVGCANSGSLGATSLGVVSACFLFELVFAYLT